MDELLQQIRHYMQIGCLPKVRECIAAALEQGLAPCRIMDDGLVAGMDELSRRFDSQDVFVPEVLVAARALNKGMEMLAPYLMPDSPESIGTAVIGTVRGDLHDVGKNLVKIMLESRSIRVIDLGIDVSAETFISAVRRYRAGLVLCTTLLTTTMDEMQSIIAHLRAADIDHEFKIMIGGAPVTQTFCDQIGADAYTENALEAANCAVRLLRKECDIYSKFQNN